MNWGEETLRLVDRYLDGNLNKKEVEDFHKRLLEDSTFEEEVKLYESLKDTLGNKEDADFLDQLNSIHSSSQKIFVPIGSRTKKTTRRRWVISIAAALLLFVVTKGLFINISLEDIQDKYLPQSQKISLVTKGNSSQQLHEIAQTSYNEGEFTKAIGAFSALLQMNPTDVSLMQYRSQALYFSKNYEESEKEFRTITNNPEILDGIRDEARMWLCYVYLKKGDLTKLAQESNVLSTSTSPSLKKKADEIIRNLDDMKE